MTEPERAESPARREPVPPCVLVAALSIYEGRGGIQKFNRSVIDALSSEEGRPIGNMIVLSLNDGNEGATPANCRYIPCRGSRWRFVAAFVWSLLRVRPSVAFLAHVNLSALGLLVKLLRRGAATALFVHGIEVWNERDSRPIPLFERAIVRRLIDTVVAVSAFTENIMRREYGLRGKNFRRLANAVDLADNQPARDHPGHRIVSAARLDEPY